MAKDKFKYDVIKESSVEAYEELPKHFLADTLEEAEELYKEYYALLNNLSYTYSLSVNIDKSDLFGEALVGLARAKRDFDPKRSSKFKTFAIYKIKSALNEYVRKNSMSITAPAYIRNANRHLMLLKDAFESCGMDIECLLEAFDIGKLETEPLNTKWLKKRADDLFSKLTRGAERAGISVKELVRRAEHIPTDVRYDDYIDAEEISLQEERRLEMALLIENLKSHLTKTEVQVCEGIMEDKTYEEIASTFGHKPPWVNFQLDKIRRKLEHEMRR
ncbi:MAG: sigma-70 family RNA polymerase sigma factor [Candidatus Bathyarchaeia archaeon]